MTERLVWDGVIVVGGGLAGLSAALAAAPRRVLLVSPTPLGRGSASAWAQGGLAAALSPDDNPARHAADTIAAGAGRVDGPRALELAQAGPRAVRTLAELGVPFDRDAAGAFVQSLEAAHSRARVARVGGDNAGREIVRAVAAAVMAAPNVTLWTDARLQALVQDGEGCVCGAVFLRAHRRIEVRADAVVLATGGVGGLYAVTTDPPEVRGEGLGLAAMAGARIADAEFVQFHPTALDLGIDPAPLATEALRGEGARLLDRTGRAFMADYDARGDLAPRDVVARAIAAEIGAGRGAFLDARAAVGEAFPSHFPTVFAACMAAGLDPRRRPMPVAPAAHYHMGGVAADLDGRTSLEGLLAAGECACTGVHGANRLASNSLLEAAVCGGRAGALAARATPVASKIGSAAPSSAPELSAEAFGELRRAMTRDAGVERDAEGLGRLRTQLESMSERYGRSAALVAADLIAEAAWLRVESCGAHLRRDAPLTSGADASLRTAASA